MINIFWWFLYYLKCAYNIIYSYLSNITISKRSSSGSINRISKYLYVVKLHGSYLSMGKQYGKFMKKILVKDVNISIKFIKDNSYIFIKKIPTKYKKDNIFESILMLYEENKKYFNPDILNFMKGISITSKIEYDKLVSINLFTDLMDNHCILLSKEIENKILNLRTFDYGCPQLCHSLIILNPINRNSYISLNVSFAVGLVSGISKNGIFFGESYYDSKIGNLSYIGMPFHHISHKILSEANNLKGAEDILKNCNRKSNLQLLISDNNNSKIYLSCVDNFLTQQEGSFVYSVTPNEKKNFDKNFHYLDTIDNIIKKFIPKTKSGELHIMITYNNKLYVSVTTDILQSYNNTFYEFELNDLFS